MISPIVALHGGVENLPLIDRRYTNPRYFIYIVLIILPNLGDVTCSLEVIYAAPPRKCLHQKA